MYQPVGEEKFNEINMDAGKLTGRTNSLVSSEAQDISDYDHSTELLGRNIIPDFELHPNRKRSRICPSSSSVDTGGDDSSSSVPAVSGIDNLRESALFDGTFYKVIEEGDNFSLKAECQICLPKKHHIKGRKNVTTNFLKHLKCKHVTNYQSYLKYKTDKRAHSEKKLSVVQGNSLERKQINIASSFARSKTITQEEFDRRLIKFVVNTMSAISLFDNSSFITIFEGFDLKVMSRSTAIRKIEDTTKKILNDVKTNLQNIEFICTTADIWSSKRRSFLGVTCHWIDPQTLERKSAALACRIFCGSHSYDRIAEMLDDIHMSFDLHHSKITGTVTDNASNFIKAFKEFGVDISPKLIINLVHENDPHISQTDCEEIENKDDIEDIMFIPENEEILENEEEASDTSNINLPKHYRCITHSLNLIATSDVMKIINRNQVIRTKHSQIMNKCSQLWNKAGRPKTSEIIKEVLGHHLSYPGITRWNSHYDSISQILKEKDKLSDLYEKLSIRSLCLKENEIEYLTEYVKILQPIALALDVLQGEKNTYFGLVIPTIASLKIKLVKLTSDNFKYLRSVLDGVILAVSNRFKRFLIVEPESESAILASVSHPSFKLRWISLLEKDLPQSIGEQKENIKKMFTNAVNEIAKYSSYQSAEIKTQGNILNMDFFEFENDVCTSGTETSGELEALQYLQDTDSNLHMLNKYPNIKTLFLKYNTTLPSSAPVERMFSYATFIDAPRRHALSDRNFENLVLMKANAA